MGMYDWVHYCVDNQITRGAAGYVVKVAESLSGTAIKPAAAPTTQIVAAPMKPLWKLAGHSHYFLRLAAVSGSAAVCLGAYGAHRHWEDNAEKSLKDDIDHRKKQFEVANHYHFYHTLALMAVPLARFPLVSGMLFTTGIIFFCGPIYYSSVSGDKTYNRLTPFGGVSFIIAWLTLVL